MMGEAARNFISPRKAKQELVVYGGGYRALVLQDIVPKTLPKQGA
jgi:hypothetical protein